MYGLIWRVLPGPWISKLIMALGLLVGVGLLLWFFAFPAISPHMPFNDGAVETGGGGGAAGDGSAQAEVPGGASGGQ
ncbi:hypothetical protein [Nocardiopsis halotolerans]|uniref:hypothetical protein n=1 Tax=Nocardiopsis halotolerans TaxID=124252 RepID=UPI00034826C3|nr:hypothetical protein [Nocardiopsis halotolerans]